MSSSNAPDDSEGRESPGPNPYDPPIMAELVEQRSKRQEKKPVSPFLWSRPLTTFLWVVLFILIFFIVTSASFQCSTSPSF